MMATGVATAISISADGTDLRPVPWDEWITLALRDVDEPIRTARSVIRAPTVVIAVNYAKVPKRKPKLCTTTIRQRERGRCAYTGRLLNPSDASLDHILPRSRGGKDTWENLVYSDKKVNEKKANKTPQEAGLKLLVTPKAPREMLPMEFLRPSHPDHKLFLG